MLDKLGKRKFIIPFVLPVLVVCLFSLMFCPMAQMELRNLPVAVVNLDEGIELPSGTLNIGSEITEGLESGEGIEGTSVFNFCSLLFKLSNYTHKLSIFL